jgi:LmbE family N-acetylglucosaminyl deacetylase
MNRESAIDLLVRLCAEVHGSYPAPPAAIVVAHPDDECLGAGSRLPWLRRAALVHITDGAPRDLRDANVAGFATRQEYALERRCELKRALALAGIVPDQTLELGYADQESSLHLGELPQVLAKIFRALQPEMVLTHPYEGGHPDHDATAFGVQAACRLLAAQQFPVPVVIEMTSYHSRDGAMAVGEFLRGDRQGREREPGAQIKRTVAFGSEGGLRATGRFGIKCAQVRTRQREIIRLKCVGIPHLGLVVPARRDKPGNPRAWELRTEFVAAEITQIREVAQLFRVPA